MSHKHFYPVLFRPEETILGPFEGEDPNTLLLYTDMKGGGYRMRVVEYTRGQPPRTIVEVSGVGWQAVIDLCYQRLQEDKERGVDE